MTNYSTEEKIKLSGFNNLTKILSFNLYDFCLTFDDAQKEEYINWINEKYSADKIIEISREICKIIDSDIISESKMNFEPVGASTMTLMSDAQGGKWEDVKSTPAYSAHLTKSHLTSHTYPDASDPNGICTYRVDFDIATCGDIIPLRAINHLFKAFECDVVYIDYVVRGYTRLENGKKIYNDEYFNSIQDFIDPKILENYTYRSDLNIPRDNIWQTKLMAKDFGPERFVFSQDDVNRPDIDEKMKNLYLEMKDVFHLY
ncbi:MAG: S-adenosylmethionine decarboxylase [Halobacteriovoraceae bacterium]|nr:S-adenosylmethionine decarboxylase [Peredibacter sp.]MBJ00629.1 S-adenosylmethionine decarboxylase [Halobacteriovoraceae bacterium]|tara:strand:+ start:8096 stop:8872 length:777 start_codon:yes stop_codon:yes gene_type:complete